MRSWLVPLFLCTLMSASVAAAQPDDHPAKVELLANVSAIKPGEPFTVGIRFTMQPHWHVYWLNPGDSGMPPQVKWKLPEGFTVSELQFPVPKKFEQPGDMVGYGYEDEVLLTATTIRGRYAIRLCVLNHTSTVDDVAFAIDRVAEAEVSELALGAPMPATKPVSGTTVQQIGPSRGFGADDLRRVAGFESISEEHAARFLGVGREERSYVRG